MTAAVALRIAAADALVINQIPMLVWKGIPEEQAAYFLSATFLAIIPLRFGMGLAAMLVPSRWLLFGGMTVGAISAGMFLVWSGYLAAAMFVLSIAATEGIATLGWLAVGEYFGRRSFGSLVGIMTVSFGVGSLAAPVAAGLVFDRTGEYGIALIVAAIMQLGSGVCYLLARRPG
jgi:MFS family permease